MDMLHEVWDRRSKLRPALIDGGRIGAIPGAA
jgi:hypothetical protein